jgi:hypothetical protein
MVLKRQRWGAGVGFIREWRYGTGGEGELDREWEGLMGNAVSDVGGIGEEREEAKRSFVRMMKGEAGEGAVLRDQYRILVGTGVKLELMILRGFFRHDMSLRALNRL